MVELVKDYGPHHTGTLAPLLLKRELTESEKAVAGYFFSSIDTNVKVALSTMPPRLWGFLTSKNSRTSDTMIENFLAMFGDMGKERDKMNAEGKNFNPEDYMSIDECAKMIRHGDAIKMEYFLRRAGSFESKWGVQFKHESVQDHDNICFVVEGLTQFATWDLEESEQIAAGEKSSRYNKMQKSATVVPPELSRWREEIDKWHEMVFDRYEKATMIVKGYLREKISRDGFATEEEHKRTIAGKTLDIARYFLPNTLQTLLGFSMPAREAIRHIGRLQSRPHYELRLIGHALQEEGMKVSPEFMREANQSRYVIDSQAKTAWLALKLSENKPETVNGRGKDFVKLLYIDPLVEFHMAAAMLFENDPNAAPYGYWLDKIFADHKLVPGVFASYLSSRGNYEMMGKSAKFGTIIMEFCVDLGAARDIKRHRPIGFRRQQFTTLNGYEYPEFCDEKEMKEVKLMLEEVCEKTHKLHTQIALSDRAAAEYVVLLAHKQRFIIAMDPRQLAYMVELRTGEAGHQSYRHAFQQAFRICEPYMPEFSKYINVNMKGYTDRRKQEASTVRRLAELGGDLLEGSTEKESK